MSYSLPDGSIVTLATTYGAVKPATLITNANPATVTSTGHLYANGDLVEVTSGWGRVNGQIYRVSGITANTFNLEGLDTSNTTTFTPGGGVGSVRAITQFLELPQILEFTTSGGDQQFATFSFLAEDFERQLPTIFSAQSISIGMADDPLQPGIIALAAASNARAPRALRLSLPNGNILLYNGYPSYNATPSLTKGQLMQVKATFTLVGRPVRY